jgi:hypothetical protein
MRMSEITPLLDNVLLDASTATGKSEEERLQRVFHWMDHDDDGYVGEADVTKTLNFYKYSPRHERDVRDMIWEVDEDGDGMIGWSEMLLMYRRVRHDKTNMEPFQLFGLVEYVMMDFEFCGIVTVDDVMRVAHMRDGPGFWSSYEKEIQRMFNGSTSALAEVTLFEYLEYRAKCWLTAHKMDVPTDLNDRPVHQLLLSDTYRQSAG